MLLVPFLLWFLSRISISRWYSGVCFLAHFSRIWRRRTLSWKIFEFWKGICLYFSYFFLLLFFVIALIIFSYETMLFGCFIFSLVVMRLLDLLVVSSLSMIGRIRDRCENQMMRKWCGHQKKHVSIRANTGNLISLMSRCFMFLGLLLRLFL